MADVSDAEAIIESTKELALAASIPEEIDEDAPFIYGLTVPHGATHTIVDLERYAPHPRRKKAFPTFESTESFAAYVLEHETPGTTLYANPEDTRVVAMLDDHAKTEPGHREHSAALQLIPTPGCERWVSAHAKYQDQLAFAQLIEDGMTEIARPDGAELLEVAQSISATKNATFRSDRRLQTGRVQFAWHEELDAAAGHSGDLTIPETVTLVFDPFYGAKRIEIDARFRYRLNSGKLTMGFWLIRHEEALRDAFTAELDRLQELLNTECDTKIDVLIGTP